MTRFSVTDTPPQYQQLFLLSHMRANTSLIGHILGSHPSINGYYEMHLSYQCKDDLVKQKNLYLKHDLIKDNSQYLFDKILHNKYLIKPEKLIPQHTKILMTTRSAETTIKSIVALFKSKTGEHSYASPDNATRYFTERLNQLAEFCKQYPKSYHYFDADLIRTTPDLLLKSLQQWLNLSTPLSKTYQSFSQTGLQRAGDTSAMIKQGHIINQPSNYENIFIPPALLQKAEAIHTEVKSLLIKNAIETERMT